MNLLIRGLLFAGLAGVHAIAQAQSSTYTVKPGDSVVSIAEALRPQEATMNQMALALVRANGPAFQAGPVRLPVGTSLTVPDLAEVLKIDAETASRQFGNLWKAEQHYRAAQALERSRDMLFAFTSYVEAAKLGHGLAQRRLGELYDRDLSGFIQRDLQESMRWYEQARLSQVDVRRQGSRMPKQR
jgi:TPR repeat protein